MANLYYEFTDQTLEQDKESYINDFIEQSWSKVSVCPFKQIPSLVTNSASNIIKLYEKIKTNYFAGLPDEEDKYFTRSPATIKTCPGVSTVLRNSVMIKAPCDIHISTQGEQAYSNFSSSALVKEVLIDHGTEQYTTKEGKNLFGNFFDIKIILPIRWSCDKETIFLHPHFHGPVPWTIVNGAFSKNYATSMNIIAMFPISDEIQHYYIKKGTVLAYLWSPEKIKLNSKKKVRFSFPEKFIGNS